MTDSRFFLSLFVGAVVVIYRQGDPKQPVQGQ